MRNIQVLFKSRPVGWVDHTHFEIVENEAGQPADGEVLIRNLYLSVDPYMRGRMRESKSYIAAFVLGEPLQGGGVGEVVASNAADLPVGSYVTGLVGWEEYTVAPAKRLTVVNPDVAPLPSFIGALGMPGMTAWIGMKNIGRQQSGETVVVSAAAGAVGQMVGQIAKLSGCRVVGIVGTDQKRDFVVRDLGFDAAINYKTTPAIGSALKDSCPQGIDVYFDNVGGEILDAVLARVNPFARIAACGMISQYNLEKPDGIRNLLNIVGNRVLIQGFIVSDHMDRLAEFHAEMGEWLQTGTITYRQDVTQGIANAPTAFIGMLKGENFGKAIVEVAQP